MAQDDNSEFYEIQLTNKQLVFYFMAGAAGLVLSFLAGVMVGKGVEAVPESRPAAAARVQEERVVPEEPVRSEAPPSPESLTYAKRLEGDRRDEGLEKPASPEPEAAAPALAPVASPSAEPATAAASPTPAPTKAPGKRGKPSPTPRPTATPSPAASTPAPTTAPSPASPKASPTPKAGPAPAEAPAGTFTIQVGAYKDRASADRIVKSLKKSGFAAYVTSAAAGLYQVRVGSYKTRAEADPTLARLREKKFDPRVVPRN